MAESPPVLPNRQDTKYPPYPRAPYYYDKSGNTGGLPQRKNIRRTLLASASTSDTQGSFDLDKEAGANLLQISCQQPCRLLLYATEADRTADLDRLEGDYPITPCLLDIRFGNDITTQSFRLFDQGEEGIYLLNRDDPARLTIYWRVVPDTDFIVDGYFVLGFGGGVGPPEVLADDGMLASSAFGLAYVPQSNTNPFNRFDAGTGQASGGWDNYWVTWGGGPPGLRARSGATDPIARYWSDVPLTETAYAMRTAFQWSPLAPLIDASWFHAHYYFCAPFGSSDVFKRKSTLQINFTKHAIHEGQVSIQWTDDTGTTLTLASDATDYDVSTPRVMMSEVVDNIINVYIDNVLSCTATIPPVLLSSARRGVGIQLQAQTVPDATRNYAGLACYGWDIKVGRTFPIVLDLGYVPLEAPGGSLRTASGAPPRTTFAVS